MAPRSCSPKVNDPTAAVVAPAASSARVSVARERRRSRTDPTAAAARASSAPGKPRHHAQRGVERLLRAGQRRLEPTILSHRNKDLSAGEPVLRAPYRAGAHHPGGDFQ